jgi:hypothetical protein
MITIKRKTFVLWKKRVFFFFISLSVFSLVYVFFGTSFFTVTSYELVGVPDMNKENIKITLAAISSEKFFGIIPANKIFSYHGTKFKKTLVSVLPNTQKITISSTSLHTIHITVNSYEPFFKIDDTHAITKEGVIYPESKDMSTFTTLILASSSLIRQVEKDIIISHVVDGIDSTIITKISILSNKVTPVLFPISRIAIDDSRDISLYDVRGMSRVVFASDADIDKVWSNLVSAIDTEPLKTKLNNNKDMLEYLDTRFGNKVFYKFTNDTKTIIIPSHATTTQVTASTTTLSR